MLGIITQFTVKQPTEKSCGVSMRIVGSVSENILPEGKDSATDPTKKGVLTMTIQGMTPLAIHGKMKARYKTSNAGTEITWAFRPDDAPSSKFLEETPHAVLDQQLYTVSFTEEKKGSGHGV